MKPGGSGPPRAPSSPRLDDRKTDRAIRDQSRAVAALAARPGVSLQVISDVELEDGVETPVAHDAGREPSFVGVSPVRGVMASGRIEEIRTSTTYNRNKYVVLKATAWGATITVDVLVVP